MNELIKVAELEALKSALFELLHNGTTENVRLGAANLLIQLQHSNQEAYSRFLEGQQKVIEEQGRMLKGFNEMMSKRKWWRRKERPQNE